jgi:hypothetical protein
LSLLLIYNKKQYNARISTKFLELERRSVEPNSSMRQRWNQYRPPAGLTSLGRSGFTGLGLSGFTGLGMSDLTGLDLSGLTGLGPRGKHHTSYFNILWNTSKYFDVLWMYFECTLKYFEVLQYTLNVLQCTLNLLWMYKSMMFPPCLGLSGLTGLGLSGLVLPA